MGEGGDVGLLDGELSPPQAAAVADRRSGTYLHLPITDAESPLSTGLAKLRGQLTELSNPNDGVRIPCGFVSRHAVPFPNTCQRIPAPSRQWAPRSW
ncbi:hypothetical protein GCM10009662_56840 [Catellatospora coxensis]|uniref:Uncharacterized protein n=1 Tax=Catellatospora coxensis TaxID=310354 RepID=A0A8J3P543_9ACTN|nr:hypothetical protein Cco03nite_07070 [Catellatospora coxensis]